MAIIANTKTWTKTRVTATGITSPIANRNLLIAVKDAMKTYGGWTFVSASYYTGATQVVVSSPSADPWTAETTIVIAAAGTNHSWIVLQNNSISSGFQICFDMAITDTYSRKMYAYMSFSAGFTSGTITNRPTATDELKLNILSDCWSGETGNIDTKSANVFTSSDHQCTRVYFNDGSTTNQVAGIWLFDVPQNCSSWVDNKAICMMNFGSCVHANHDTAAEAYPTMYLHGNQLVVSLGTLYLGTTRFSSYAGVAGATGDYNSNWPCTPMWLISQSTAVPGIIGILYDLWWAHATTVANGDYFPGDGSRNQVVIGNMIQGSDGSAFVL